MKPYHSCSCSPNPTRPDFGLQPAEPVAIQTISVLQYPGKKIHFASMSTQTQTSKTFLTCPPHPTRRILRALSGALSFCNCDAHQQHWQCGSQDEGSHNRIHALEGAPLRHITLTLPHTYTRTCIPCIHLCDRHVILPTTLRPQVMQAWEAKYDYDGYLFPFDPIVFEMLFSREWGLFPRRVYRWEG